MSKVKNQHLVPKLYLKNFSNSKVKPWPIYVFDKPKQESFATNITNIATEKYYYDIPVEYQAGEPDLQIFEKLLGFKEDNYSKVLRQAIQHINVHKCLSHETNPVCLGDKLKIQLSEFIALQAIRTDEYRRMIGDSTEEIISKIARGFAKEAGKIPKGFDVNELLAEIDPKYVKAQHLMMLADPEMLKTLTSVFYNKIWLVGFNPTTQPLYTSDHPVALHFEGKRGPHGVGYASLGTEVFIPINSRFVIKMFDRKTYAKTHGRFENRIVSLEDGNVEFHNSIQVRDATRQVFCCEDKFDLAKDYVKEFPLCVDVNRRRVSTY